MTLGSASASNPKRLCKDRWGQQPAILEDIPAPIKTWVRCGTGDWIRIRFCC
jgi:hypothetical protein